MVDPILFDDLGSADPKEVIQRTGAWYDPATGRYTLELWGRILVADPKAHTVTCDGNPLEGDWSYWPLVAVHTLLGAKDMSCENTWVSEKDLTGGSAFFTGPHTLPTQEVAEKFGRDLQGFFQVCTRLGGRPLAMADAAFAFDITPQIPAALLLWQADEEFGAQAKLLFDKTIDRHFALDIVFAVGVTLCRVVAGNEEGY